jgi:hypothetical protein
MTFPTALAGVLTLGVVPMVIGYFLLRRYRMLQWFFLALLLVGLGYLGATGAIADVGQAVMIALGYAPVLEVVQ